MPVTLPTTFGKADYNVVQSLQKLADACNALEQQLTAARGRATLAEVQALEAALNTLTARVNALSRESSEGGGGGSGTVVVDPAGALDGDGSSGSPLAVKVDGSSIIINGSNELEAPAAAGGITQLTGDVTAGPGSGSQAATIANNAVTSAKINAGAVTTAKITDANVTYAKIQNVSASLRILARKSGGAGVIEEATIAEILEFIAGSAQGDILIRNGTVWTRLGIGAAGTVLTSAGAGADPSWVAPAGGTPNPNHAQVIYNHSQILAANTTPVEMIPAPGAGKLVSLFALHSVKQTTAGGYATNPNWSARYNGVATDLCTAQSITITAADQRYRKFTTTDHNITSPPFNTSVVMRGTADTTAGNAANYIVFEAVYSLITDGP